MFWILIKTFFIYLWLRIKRTYYVIIGEKTKGMVALIPPVILRTMTEKDIKRITLDFKDSDTVQLMVHYDLVNMKGNVVESNKRMITNVDDDYSRNGINRLRRNVVLSELYKHEDFI